MDTFDAEVHRRLAALAEAVPVAPEAVGVTRVSRPTPRPSMSRFSLPVTAAAVVLAVVGAFALSGRGGPPATASPVPAVATSPDATFATLPSATPLDRVAGSPAAGSVPSPRPTRPPADVAVAYPEGCAPYNLSPRRCAYIAQWALTQAGVPADGTRIELLGDPLCSGQPTRCPIRLGGTLVLRVRITPASAVSTDYPVLCGIGAESSLLCTDAPRIRIVSPMAGYHDTPCGPEPAPGGCASAVPTMRPAAAKRAVALEIWTVEIPVDHAGDYSIAIGDAVLPNGILTEASATLADDRRTDVLIPDGVHLEVIGDDGQPLLDAYRQGWRPGTERVHVRIAFTVASFDPGATLYITDVVVR